MLCEDVITLTDWYQTLEHLPDAYQAGYTNGLNRESNTNPFVLGTEEHREYEEGYNDGKWDST